ncbi:MAG: 5,6-dimethylbenzimidazole synthase [Rhodospirillaceae bacterium]|nr:5,6-dimethylbenzimidazole synthase [Rhodospirillaceae bacterium]MBT7486064.1 5,6-dimethylbenzimidazole synthase [Rhodospirillales bacterium]
MNAPLDKSPAPDFDAAFLAGLEDLLRWRRDVRRFLSDAVPSDLLDELLTLAALAPSVGNSQPWRFVKVNAPERRAAIRENFEACNADALADYEGERAKLYATLKLNGFDQAPVHLAVFLDTGGELGHGLGAKTMPETLAYSVVGAIQTFWLAARSRGIGVGWVSILDADKVRESLDVSEDWQLIGYLCVGYPQEEHIDPELDRHGWQERVDVGRFIVER